MIDKFEADAAIRALFGMMNPPRIEALVAFVMQVQEDAVAPFVLPVAIPEPDTTHYAQWAGEELKPNEHGEYPDLQVGQRVRVHTGEEGTIAELRTGYTKRYRVLTRPGFGGVYGSWEVTPIGAGDDRQDG